MNIKYEIFINQIIQGIKSFNEGVNWFEMFDDKIKLDILRGLNYMMLQSGAQDSDVDLAIFESKLKPTYTPCVLLKKGRLNDQSWKILNLPASEYRKSFILFLIIFKIADERRRNLLCKGNCSHWWHKDLSDKKVVDEILNDGALHRM